MAVITREAGVFRRPLVLLTLTVGVVLAGVFAVSFRAEKDLSVDEPAMGTEAKTAPVRKDGEAGGQSRVAGPPGPEEYEAFRRYDAVVVGHLRRFSRYPRGALERNVSGAVMVSFTLDTQGNVTSSQVVKSSGDAELDGEALALLERASPLPPLPSALASGGRRFTTVFRFAPQ